MYLFSEPCSFSRSRVGTDKCLSFGFELRFSLTLVVKDLFRLTELMLNADIMFLAVSLRKQPLAAKNNLNPTVQSFWTFSRKDPP